MPELPEVEHVKRGVAPVVEGQRILSVTFSPAVIAGKADGKETIIKGGSLDDFIQHSVGYVFTRVERRSKYIVFHLENEHTTRVILSHLGMAGGYFVVPTLDDITVPNYRKHWHVIFELDNGMKLVYSDIRRFGELRNIENYDAYPSFLAIAPEPFETEAKAYYMHQINMKRHLNKPIKQLILDHRIIAGCGNIYACEALYLAGIHPSRTPNELTPEAQARVFDKVRHVLELGIAKGGTSISDYRHADGNTGEMQNHLNVYKQRQCLGCGHEIETKVIATRNSHFCPICQK